MAPQPPAPGSNRRVSTVMAGQIIEDPNGRAFVIPEDGVLIELFEDGRPAAFLTLPAQAAIRFALAVQSAAVTAQNSAVDDQGNKLPLGERLARLSAAYKKAGS